MPATKSTRLLMVLAAAFVAALGMIASFLPQELLRQARVPENTFSVAVIQLGGALYVGFAMLNWSAKGNLLGGIYGRPIVIANFTHFAIGTIVLVKLLVAGKVQGGLWVVAGYSILATWFAYVLFGAGPREA